MKIPRIFLALCFLGASHTLFPKSLTGTELIAISCGCGVVAGSAAGFATTKLLADRDYDSRIKISAATGLAVGTASFLSMYYALYPITYTAKLAKLGNEIATFGKDKLFCITKFGTPQLFASAIKETYGWDVPSLEKVADRIKLFNTQIKGHLKTLKDILVDAQRDIIQPDALYKNLNSLISTHEEWHQILNKNLFYINVFLDLEHTSETIRDLQNDLIIMSDAPTVEELVSQATIHFGTDWPLVLAREYFVEKVKNLKNAYASLKSIMVKIIKNPELEYVTNSVNADQECALQLIDIINAKVASLIHHLSYQEQVYLHEKSISDGKLLEHRQKMQELEYKENEKRRQHEKDLKQSEIRAERDRQYEELRQREREIELKQKILEKSIANNNSAITVNGKVTV